MEQMKNANISFSTILLLRRGFWLVIFKGGQKMVLRALYEVKCSQWHLLVAIENDWEANGRFIYFFLAFSMFAF